MNNNLSTMPTQIKQQSKTTITVDREEYQALLHATKVTSEYLQGNYESFDSTDALISNLKSL